MGSYTLTVKSFVPVAQNYQGRITVLVRSKQNADALMPAIRQQVSALDPALPVFGVRTMPQFLNRLVEATRSLTVAAVIRKHSY